MNSRVAARRDDVRSPDHTASKGLAAEPSAGGEATAISGGRTRQPSYTDLATMRAILRTLWRDDSRQERRGE